MLCRHAGTGYNYHDSCRDQKWHQQTWSSWPWPQHNYCPLHIILIRQNLCMCSLHVLMVCAQPSPINMWRSGVQSGTFILSSSHPSFAKNWLDQPHAYLHRAIILSHYQVGMFEVYIIQSEKQPNGVQLQTTRLWTSKGLFIHCALPGESILFLISLWRMGPEFIFKIIPETRILEKPRSWLQGQLSPGPPPGGVWHHCSIFGAQS